MVFSAHRIGQRDLYFLARKAERDYHRDTAYGRSARRRWLRINKHF